MLRLIWIAAFAALLLVPKDAGAQSQGLVVKQSAFSVSETMDRLEKILTRKGFEIFARINHAESAESIDQQLRPAEILIFGNPKITVPLMQEQPSVGLEMPLKALVHRDEAGKVFLIYDHPAYTARRHGIKKRGKLVKAVARILINLTDQAVKRQ